MNPTKNQVNSRAQHQCLYQPRDKSQCRWLLMTVFVSCTFTGIAGNELLSNESQSNHDRGQIGSKYSLRKSVVASGKQSKSGGFEMKGAIAQAVVGQSSVGGFKFNAGFFHSNRDLIFRNDLEPNN